MRAFMELGLSQYQALKQIQTLSPQMYMSMEILCLNSLDLEQRVAQELENNETLERVEPVPEDVPESGVAAADATVAVADPADEAFDARFERWEQYAAEESSIPRSSRIGSGDGDEKYEALSNTEGRPESLQEHLDQQTHLVTDDEIRDLHRRMLEGRLSWVAASSVLSDAARHYNELRAAGKIPVELREADVQRARDVAIEVIYNLDGRGYLLYSFEDMLEHLVTGAEPAKSGSTVGGRRSSEAAGLVGAVGRNADAGLESSAPKRGSSEEENAPDGVALDEVSTDRSTAPGSDTGDGDLFRGASGANESAAEIAAEVARDGFRLIEAPSLRPDDAWVLGLACAIVIGLDPAGVGGRTLEECLLLQLRRDPQEYPLEEKIIRGHLGDLGHNRLPKISRALGVSMDELKEAAENIASLNPLPGQLYSSEIPRYVRPDVVVEEVEGRYEVRVESDYIPRIQISDHYRSLYERSKKDPEIKKYLKKKLDNAEWLLSAIRQRQSTLLRIAQAVVEVQSEFLDHGISHLRPLKMADIAEKLGVHVSTISRAISGKYIQTSRGIYDLKFFFTGGATKDDGNVEARGSVIQRIKDLIANEDKADPLSDISIVRKLTESGIQISRRTVTKYREAEGIPSSRERRSY
jgi:RNA polymerase sigma-54 factor